MDDEQLAGMLATLAEEIEAEQGEHPYCPLLDIEKIAAEMGYTLPELCEALREASSRLTNGYEIQEEVQVTEGGATGAERALTPAMGVSLPLPILKAAWLYQEVPLSELAGTALEDVVRDYGGHAFRLWVSGDEANARYALYLHTQRRMGVTSLALATEVRWATCESAEQGIGLYADHRERFITAS